MTQEEAMRRLQGTWAFETTADRVLVADVGLLERVAEIERRRDGPLVGPSAAVRLDPVRDSVLESVPG